MRRAAILSILALGSLAPACLTLSGAGRAPVAIAFETATIVWDPATKTEHFIRAAAFQSDGKPIGFLVPTPTPPKVTAVEPVETSFAEGELQREIAPKVVTKKRPVYRLSDDWTFLPPAKVAAKSLVTAASMQSVEVLSQDKIGNYDVAVLRADDQQALNAWLKKHGFASDERLAAWLDPYIAKGWPITAFRFVPPGPNFVGEPVMLSFKTERPFYPYREPKATQSPATRSLRVYFVAPERMAGELDAAPWPAATEYAAELTPRAATQAASAYGLSPALFRGRCLTSFLDRTAVRPLSELYFTPAAIQADVIPPPIVREVEDPVYLPKASVFSAALISALALVAIRPKRKRS